MAGKRRHWKEKGGRFWARVAVPKAIQPILGKSELIEPLGGDRRKADRNHAAAVARLQETILQAKAQLDSGRLPSSSEIDTHTVRPVDYQEAAWTHYNQTLHNDKVKRDAMPTLVEIDLEYERTMQKAEADKIDVWRDPIGLFNAHTEYELMAGARHFDMNLRTRRLAALKSSLALGDIRLVDTAVQKYVNDKSLGIAPESLEWHELAHHIARGEIAALEQTLRMDKGEYGTRPSDPIVSPPAAPANTLPAVPLKELFKDYIASRKVIGTHQDGGANWEYQIESLIKFLGHSDARKITKRNLLDWRDSLIASGKSAKTVSDKSLAAVKAVLRWAFQNDKLPTNEAETVRQELPKTIRTREKGYTTAEAGDILRISVNYQPATGNTESAHRSATKRWVPLLCAFTGARALLHKAAADRTSPFPRYT